MRILQINTVAQGSTGRIACEIAQHLSQKKHSSLVLYGIGESYEFAKNYCQKVSSSLSVKIHSALSQFFDAEGLGSIFTTKKICNIIKQYKPDIIHLHNIHGCYINYIILFNFLKKYGKPIVWTLHDCWPMTGHCAYFDYVSCNKWKNTCNNCPQSKTSYPRNKFFDRSRSNYKLKKKVYSDIPNLHIVAPSKWMEKLVSQSFIKCNLHTIINGVDTEKFHPIKYRLPYNLDGKKVLLAVAGQWEERKGLKYLLQIANMINDNYKLVIIGIDESQKSFINKDIIAIRKLDHFNELSAWYSRADVFLNPTLEDNMPLVNLESLACGTPVVAFNTGGCSEIIDAKVGTIVEKGNIHDFYSAIMDVAQDKEKYFNNCIQRAQLFDKYKCYDKYIELYENIKL